MVKGLTEPIIEKLKPEPGRRREIPDAGRGGVPGLYLIVQPSGRKSWAIRYRFLDRPVKQTIGPWPAFGLKDARKVAAAVRLEAEIGETDPRAPKRSATDDQFDNVVFEWFKHDQAENRSARDVRKLFDRDVIPHWKHRSIVSITRRDCADLIDRVKDRGAVTQARRLHAHLHRLFRWSVGRGILADNPMRDLPKPGREVRRDRVLDDEELSRVWHAMGSLGFPFATVFKLLILTGCRREEIRALRWSEIDLETQVITLAGIRTKNGDRHEVPLSHLVT